MVNDIQHDLVHGFDRFDLRCKQIQLAGVRAQVLIYKSYCWPCKDQNLLLEGLQMQLICSEYFLSPLEG